MYHSNTFEIIIGIISLMSCVIISPATAASSAFSDPVDTTFKAKIDGTEQHYVLMLPVGFDKSVKHDLAIALHGHGSDRGQYINSDRDECRAARDVAAKHNMIFISPDYRATTSWMGPKAEADVVQIIRDIRHKHRIGKVFLIGGSMGGSSALTFAVLHPELINGVCSQNPMANHLEYTNFQEAISESYGGTKTQIPLEYKKRSAEYWPEKFTFPVAITTGGKDEAVPPQSAIRLANVLKTIGAKVLLIHRPETDHSTNYEDTTAAFEFVVGGGK